MKKPRQPIIQCTDCLDMKQNIADWQFSLVDQSHSDSSLIRSIFLKFPYFPLQNVKLFSRFSLIARLAGNPSIVTRVVKQSSALCTHPRRNDMSSELTFNILVPRRIRSDHSPAQRLIQNLAKITVCKHNNNNNNNSNTNNSKTLFKHRQIRDCCPVHGCVYTLR